jgi:hypothetical protein
MVRLDFIMNANLSIEGQIQYLENYKVDRTSNLDKLQYRKEVMQEVVKVTEEEIATRKDEIHEATKEIENLKKRKEEQKFFRTEF